MQLNILPKSPRALYPTDIVFQTSFWGQVKSRLGWSLAAFEMETPDAVGDVLVLTRRLDAATSMVYVPQGPEHAPHAETYGLFLETLSESILPYLESSTAFIRYDLPWPDPYALDEDAGYLTLRGLRRPEARLREVRMNYATRAWNFRKAPRDLTVADSLIVDISGTEEAIRRRMKPKTRYNISLAARKGVRVLDAGASSLPAFYELYRQTAARNGFPACPHQAFAALFEAPRLSRTSPALFFYLAVCGREVLAGAITAVSGKRATYLFGASSSRRRSLMAPYAVQWHAMREARALQCTAYDMGAVSPCQDPAHPFYGMYRFKTGFGGRIEHRVGSWDYPIRHAMYQRLRNSEMLRTFPATHP